MTKIKVALRVRPLSRREILGEYPVIFGIEGNTAYITDIRVPERPSADSRPRFRQFNFDHAFWLTDDADEGSSQSEVYEEMGPSLEKSILEGYNACLLAYGQSGTGKTHTMLGTKEDPGLIPRMCQGLWGKFKAASTNGSKSFRIEVSFMEIYREKVKDLLSKSEATEKSLKLREHPQLGPYVQGLTKIEIKEGMSILELLWEGERRRSNGVTRSNCRSSRSHAVWTLYLISTQKSNDGSELITRNQVHLVDLAGSEKADLITTKRLLAEGKDINRSLVSLGNVISSLAEKASYIPYRDSTLTWLLKDSLGGNARTDIIITCSPASCCHAQNLNSLRFAQRARLVENQPRINVTKAEGRKKSTGIFQSMSSPFDLKRDIARLANIIRSAQINGGVLRGNGPVNGWNRLIHAIESWSHFESEKSKSRNKNAGYTEDKESSIEAKATAGSSSTSFVDGEVQVDMNSSETDESFKSLSTSPVKNKITGTEVLIPVSNAFKCLTWKQEAVQQLSKFTSTTTTDSSEDEAFGSSPSTPNFTVSHLKYLIPLKYPVTKTLDFEGRMNEKIHGTVEKLPESIQLNPKEIMSPSPQNTPLVQDRPATLILPQAVKEMPPLEDSGVDLVWDENQNFQNVFFKGNEEHTDFSFSIPEISEFCKLSSKKHQVSTYEKSEDEHDDVDSYLEQMKPSQGNYRAVFKALKQQISPLMISMDDVGTGPKSCISSSSYESLAIPRRNVTRSYPEQRAVKVIQNNHFNFSEIEEKVENIVTPCKHKMASVISVDPPSPIEPKRRISLPNSPRYSISSGSKSGSNSSSNFRTFFHQEFHDLENIGNRIRKLQAKAERYSLIKPYLDQLDDLNLHDHYAEDPILDADIEKCSGWNVNVEMERVQQEINAINKLLRHGPSSSPKSSGISIKSRNQVSNRNRSPSSSGSSIFSFDQSNQDCTKGSNYDAVDTSKRSHESNQSKAFPVTTSTPMKKTTNAEQSSTIYDRSAFWNEFYRRNGPSGDHSDEFHGNTANISSEKSSASEKQRWRPFLPKTHNYLCHVQNFQKIQQPQIQQCYFQEPVQFRSNQHYDHPCVMSHRRPFQSRRSHHPLRSVSSDGSSIYDSSQSESCFQTSCHPSNDLCSCQGSPDSSTSGNWITDAASYETDRFKHNPQLHHPYPHLLQNGINNRSNDSHYQRYQRFA